MVRAGISNERTSLLDFGRIWLVKSLVRSGGIHVHVEFTIPTFEGHQKIEMAAGEAVYFLGANGSGKTRLAVYIEKQLGFKAHRISAHRALVLNSDVPIISEASARNRLIVGVQGENFVEQTREFQRWQGNSATSLLSDFDALLQVLFANQSNVALEAYQNIKNGSAFNYQETYFDKLLSIWNSVIPHRKLHVSGDSISAGDMNSELKEYKASDLSDGERSIFYLIGQSLVADKGSVIIFDEPEQHLHRALLSRLWDHLQSARPDCALIVISHDLEFVGSRSGRKFIVKKYNPEKWDIEKIGDDDQFPEDLITLIMGGRKPVLFIEGAVTSLDRAVYRACYPEWTIVSRGSCAEVLLSVKAMRKNPQLNRLECRGIVDADGFSAAEILKLNKDKIYTIPFSEIENIFLAPDVFKEILRLNDFSVEDIDRKYEGLVDKVYKFALVEAKLNDVVLRHVRRVIDRSLKIVNLEKAKDKNELNDLYNKKVDSINVIEIYNIYFNSIVESVNKRDMERFLYLFDDKSLFTFARQSISKKYTEKKFKEWVSAEINKPDRRLLEAVMKYMPDISV